MHIAIAYEIHMLVWMDMISPHLIPLLEDRLYLVLKKETLFVCFTPAYIWIKVFVTVLLQHAKVYPLSFSLLSHT